MNVMPVLADMRGLARFTETESPRRIPPLLLALTGAAVVVCLAGGTLLSLMGVAPRSWTDAASGHRIAVVMETVAIPRPVPAPEPEPVPVAEAPRLTPDTVLAAPVDRPAPATVERPSAAPAPAPATPAVAPPRRVYGVRRVYAQGLGGGSAAGPGLVTSQGNTVDGRRDTLTATPDDLRGELAALSTVDRAPEPLTRVKPAYSEALAAARAEGVVSAYLLVDTDGAVRGVEITEDIGHDSRAVATVAFRQFRFRPAEKAGRPVAVWILHRIRFEFQE